MGAGHDVARMQHTHRTPRTIRLAVLGTFLFAGALIAAPAVGAAMGAPSGPGNGCWSNSVATCTTTTEAPTTTEEPTTTIEPTTTTEAPTTTAEVAGETTVPTTAVLPPVSVAGITETRVVQVPSPGLSGTTELALTGPSDRPAAPLGLALVMVGATMVVLSVRAARGQRAQD